MYRVSDTDFQRGMTSWSVELVSEKETEVLEEVLLRIYTGVCWKKKKQDERFAVYYGEIIQTLSSVMDGHLLQ